MRIIKLSIILILTAAIVCAIIGAVSIRETDTYLDSVDAFITEVEG